MSQSLVRVDMHLHTHRSFDCLSHPRDILAAAAERGIDRIIVTDHNEISGALEAREIAPERVVVGEEVKTREGFDIIGIFIEEVIPRGTPARETCVRIREQGGVVYFPHPFDGSRAGGARFLHELDELVDVIEVHNARCFPRSLNDRAEEWATQRGKLMGSGSDAHTVREVGRGFVELPRFSDNRESFLAALADGHVLGRTSTSPVYRLASNWAKIRKKLG